MDARLVSRDELLTAAAKFPLQHDARQPTICLNMIVRNEAHIVAEVLDAVSPYISSWVIVDTGSTDGTQDVIREHTARLDIPGVLHERPWRDFGANRSEALALATGRADYIWVMDADDVVVGQPNFHGLSSDVYAMRIKDGLTYWRRQLFRDGKPWRYVGVVHEYADCDEPFTEARLEGDYYVESRRLGARNKDPQKYARDRDLLLAEIRRNPDDERSAFYLAESYFNLGDFSNARIWATRRAEMGGWDEETYYALWQVARCMAELDEPWPVVQDAYLRAWEFRPTRAEPLHAIAARYRSDQRFELGYLFAERASAIPLPSNEILFVNESVYTWRALDEQAVCASWIGRHDEAFALCRNLLSRPDISDDDRQRVAANRDQSVGALLEAASTYPDTLVNNVIGHRRAANIAVSLIAGPDVNATELTLNTLLHCCLDITTANRFLALDTGMSAHDRDSLKSRYPFLDFIEFAPSDEPLAELTAIRSQLAGHYWLHLDQGWCFFAADTLVGRLRAVLTAEPDVVQVGVNFSDSHSLLGACAAEPCVRRTTEAGRYLITDSASHGPAMIDLNRLDRPASGPTTASLDEVLCIKAG